MARPVLVFDLAAAADALGAGRLGLGIEQPGTVGGAFARRRAIDSSAAS